MRWINAAYFTAGEIPDWKIYTSALYNIDRHSYTNPSYCTVMLDGRHPSHFVYLPEDKKAMWRSVKLLRMRCAFPIDRKPNWQARAIKLREIASISAAILWPETKFTNKMGSLLRY